MWIDRPIATASGGQTSRECQSTSITSYTFDWDKITKIVPSSSTVKLCTSDREDCVEMNIFNNEQQSHDFAEALNIYRKQQKKKDE